MDKNQSKPQLIKEYLAGGTNTRKLGLNTDTAMDMWEKWSGFI
jgi:hypothetical protein